MTEKWKIELVETVKQIAETLPKLVEELRRFNDLQEEQSEQMDRNEIEAADSKQSADT